MHISLLVVLLTVPVTEWFYPANQKSVKQFGYSFHPLVFSVIFDLIFPWMLELVHCLCAVVTQSPVSLRRD